MDLWLHFWQFSEMFVIFTDFSPERDELIVQFLTILTNLRPERSEVIS